MPIPVLAFDPDWSELVRERTEYLTDIISSRIKNEQRVELRSRPRTLLTYRVLTLEPRDSASLAAKIFRYQGQVMGVPFWPDAQPLLSDAGIGETTIELDTTLRKFVAGGLVLLWRDPYTYEYREIDAVGDDSIDLVDPVTADWLSDGQTYVIPLLRGRLRDSQAINNPTSKISHMSLSWECEDPALTSRTGDGRGPEEFDALHECPAEPLIGGTTIVILWGSHAVPEGGSIEITGTLGFTEIRQSGPLGLENPRVHCLIAYAPPGPYTLGVEYHGDAAGRTFTLDGIWELDVSFVGAPADSATLGWTIDVGAGPRTIIAHPSVAGCALLACTYQSYAGKEIFLAGRDDDTAQVVTLSAGDATDTTSTSDGSYDSPAHLFTSIETELGVPDNYPITYDYSEPIAIFAHGAGEGGAGVAVILRPPTGGS